MVTMQEVADAANVSIATVSRVLSNKPNVRPEVRERVLKVVDDLGYRTNRTARRLRTQTSGVIGLLVSDIRNPFFTDIARAIEDIAHQNDMNVFLCNTDENPEKEALYLNTLLDENVDGIILSPTPSDAEHFTSIIDNPTPIVMIDRRIDGISADYVLSDNIESAYVLTKHLIEQGCQRINALIGLSKSTTGRERMAGYTQSMEIHGQTPLAAFVSPYEADAEAQVSAWLASDDPPDAIITGNLRLTIGTLTALQQQGLGVPDDILLAGFDETVWMQHIGKGITVISQPTYEMGRTAAELLLQRLKDTTDRPAREVILKGQLIVRGSTTRDV